MVASDTTTVPPLQDAVELTEEGGGFSGLHELESLCMRCHQDGLTKFLLVQVPHFRELLLAAFQCPHCGESNNEVQFAGAIQRHGCRYSLSLPAGAGSEALNRQVVKSDTASIRIPELDLEIPPEAQRGSLSTIEGVLRRAKDELEALQEERRRVDADLAARLDTFLQRLDSCIQAKIAFTLVLDDPAGNSFIENPNAPAADPLLSLTFYERTPEQAAAMGFLPPTEGEDNTGQAEADGGTAAANEADAGSANGGSVRYQPAGTSRQLPHGSVGAHGAHRAIAEMSGGQGDGSALLKYSAPEEVMTFPATCSACAAAAETRMFLTTIPYFKEVIVMASTCDACGYKNSELKSAGVMSERGKKLVLHVQDARDLSRDVIKSDSASIAIPEVELELGTGSLGGKVTTVEGLLDSIISSLRTVLAFSLGDSADQWSKSKWQALQAKLKKLMEVEEGWHLIIDDAMANSFIAPRMDTPVDNDPQLKVEEYERTEEQNEEWGLQQPEAATDGTKKSDSPAAAKAAENISNAATKRI